MTVDISYSTCNAGRSGGGGGGRERRVGLMVMDLAVRVRALAGDTVLVLGQDTTLTALLST